MQNIAINLEVLVHPRQQYCPILHKQIIRLVGSDYPPPMLLTPSQCPAGNTVTPFIITLKYEKTYKFKYEKKKKI